MTIPKQIHLLYLRSVGQKWSVWLYWSDGDVHGSRSTTDLKTEVDAASEHSQDFRSLPAAFDVRAASPVSGLQN